MSVPDVPEKVQRHGAFRVVLQDGRTVRYEETIPGPDGPTEVESAKTPLRDGEGRIVGLVGIARDIAGRKRAEDAMKESEARFRALFENMSSGAAIYEAVDDGADFVFADFNRAGERIEKISRGEIVGRRVTEAFPGVAEFGLLDVLRRVWRSGRPECFPIGQYRDRRISGWRENFVCRLPSGEVAAIYDDVTARKIAEAELQARNDELERFNRATVGRELDMIGMKKTINALNRELGRAPPYDLSFLEDGDGAPVKDEETRPPVSAPSG